MTLRTPAVVALALIGLAPALTSAQSLGTFRWQLQPYCNVVTLTVVQNAGQYHVDGTDDQCGAALRASAVGLAFPNPDGTIGIGLTIVTTPGAAPAHVDARIAVATLGGPWTDSAGNSGTFAFTPGAGTGGRARPLPSSIPNAIRLLTSGGLLAGGAVASGAIPASGSGTRMMWHPAKAAIRAGHVTGDEWDEAKVGHFSTAFGQTTSATAFASTALGDTTTASGQYSTALGRGTTASGSISTALGYQTHASEDMAVAMGYATTAIGSSSTAMGTSTLASGSDSLAVGLSTRAGGRASFAGGYDSEASGGEALAFGYRALAAGPASVALGTAAVTVGAAAGSFVFADSSSQNPFTSFARGEFVVRASGGVGFYTNPTATTGAEMAPGGGSWAALSDVNMKENFRDVSGEAILAKLAAMPIREWNYTSQPPAIRHLGPTAQDFRAAFGLGEYDRRITSTDADGIALAGVQALEARTRGLTQQAADVARLQAENVELRTQLAGYGDWIRRLERRLEER